MSKSNKSYGRLRWDAVLPRDGERFDEDGGSSSNGDSDTTGDTGYDAPIEGGGCGCSGQPVQGGLWVILLSLGIATHRRFSY